MSTHGASTLMTQGDPGDTRAQDLASHLLGPTVHSASPPPPALSDSQHRRVLGLIALLAFAAIGIALISQHHFDMQPCPWCIVQRMGYAAIGLVAGVGALWPRRSPRRLAWATSLVVVLVTTLGAASALWQLLYAAKSSSCVMTPADMVIGWTRLDVLLPEVFQARASCAEAAVRLLGLPYAVWSLVLFVVLAVAALRVHLEQRQRLRP